MACSLLNSMQSTPARHCNNRLQLSAALASPCVDGGQMNLGRVYLLLLRVLVVPRPLGEGQNFLGFFVVMKEIEKEKKEIEIWRLY